jgi:N-acetylglucosaminyldiphosphoundecaprenol N-acetyl-beta-D-mannosaminyltransferase
MQGFVTENIFDYPVTLEQSSVCIKRICNWLEDGAYRRVCVCLNPHSLEIAEIDIEFRNAIFAADMVIPDGVGILLASTILGGNVRRRVTGSDIFYGLSAALNKETKKKYRYFFLGSTEQNLSEIRKRLSSDCPNVFFAGCYSPAYKQEFNEKENHLMIETINRARPDVLWVGMTAPKQEKWIYRNIEKLDVKFIGSIGAVFDFYTGKVKRSNPIFQKMGIEWLPRLIKEPRRLWRRTFISSPKFIMKVLAHRFRMYRFKAS